MITPEHLISYRDPMIPGSIIYRSQILNVIIFVLSFFFEALCLYLSKLFQIHYLAIGFSNGYIRPAFSCSLNQLVRCPQRYTKLALAYLNISLNPWLAGSPSQQSTCSKNENKHYRLVFP